MQIRLLRLRLSYGRSWRCNGATLFIHAAFSSLQASSQAFEFAADFACAARASSRVTRPQFAASRQGQSLPEERTRLGSGQFPKGNKVMPSLPKVDPEQTNFGSWAGVAGKAEF